tara:strand:+ start:806 stop:1378 length:573 start_codon:yes stop_codon:yes gene_type:complete
MNEYENNKGAYSIDGNKIRVQKSSGVDSVLFEDIASISHRAETIPKRFGLIAFNIILWTTIFIQIYLLLQGLYIESLIALGIGLTLAIIAGFLTSKAAIYWDSVIIETRGGRTLTYAVDFGFGKKEMENIENARRIGHNIENKKEENKEIVDSKNSIADELKKLKSLMDEGVLTMEEFNDEKRKLLNNKN